MIFWTQPEKIIAASLNNNCAAPYGAGGHTALICTQSRGLNHVLSKHGCICPLFYGLDTCQSVMKAWERQCCFFVFHKELHSFIFLNCFLSSTKSILVSQTHPVWFLQIGFLQTSLTPLWPIRVEFKPCHSPRKKRENLTTLVLCLMKTCFHVLRHFFSFSLLVKEVPWFKKRERKEIYQAR